MQDESQKIIREGRVSSLLRDAISRFVQEHSNKDSFITVSYVQMNKSRHTVTAYCTVFPNESRERALAFLKRREHDCRDYIRKHTALQPIPTVRFSLAKGGEGVLGE